MDLSSQTGATADRQPNVVLLGIDDAAAELGLRPVEVSRLICRGDLAAKKIGDTWKMTRANIEAFATGGAVDDAKAPDLADEWYANGTMEHRAQAFEGAIIEAFAEQMPSVWEMIGEFQRDFAQTSHQWTMKETGELAKVVGQAPPSQFLGGKPTGNDTSTGWTSWASLYLAQSLRDAAGSYIRDTFPPQNRAEKFFSDPAVYANVCNAAYDAVRRRKIVSSTGVAVANPKLPADVQQKRAQFTFAVATLLLKHDQGRLVSAAF